MILRVLSISGIMFCALCVKSQELAIKGRILDENAAGLPGAQLILFTDNLRFQQSESTGEGGFFIIKNLMAGNYKLIVNLLGYNPDTLIITLKNESIDLQAIQLEVSVKKLKEIIVEDKKPVGSIRNDTVQFDAASFKVMKDASADELIEKMPSISKDQGNIKAHGDEVKQVLVDGKPFYGNDPNLSLKNLPAELIDKVQIFDQLSEQSQFTGINDGNTVKTINIVTKTGLNNSQFGKVYAGYGEKDTYQAGGNLSYFDGDRRISVLGISNNINFQNFSIDDILGVMGSSSGQRSRNFPSGQQRPGNEPRRDGRGGSGGPGDFLVPQSGGISTTHALGCNYSDKFGTAVEMNLSYFVNYSKNNLLNELTRDYFQTDSFQQSYYESNQSNSSNLNHRLNGRFEFKLDSFNSIILRPRLTFQSNTSKSNSSNGFLTVGVPTNSSKNENHYDSEGLNWSNNLLLRHKFRKPGRTVSTELNMNYAPKDEASLQNSTSNSILNGIEISDTFNIRRDGVYKKWSLQTNFEYTEPIDLLNSVSINYRYSNGFDETDLESFDVAQNDLASDSLNIELSNLFKSLNQSHQIGLAYQYNKEQKLNMSIRGSWIYTKLDNEQIYPAELTFNKSFYNVLPSFFLRYNISRTRNLNIHYRMNTQIPAISQLQNVLNTNNPIQLTLGNPDLKQAINHNFNFRYSSNNSNSTMLYLSAGGSYITNYIANHLFIYDRSHHAFNQYQIPHGVQLSIPENSKSSIQFRTFASYTIPMPKIKINISMDASYVYSETPGLLDTNSFTTYQQYTSLGFSLTSNINQKIDFNVQFRPSFNTYKSLDTRDEYVILDQRIKFNWQFFSKNIIRIEFNSKINQDLSNQFNQNIYLLNIALGMKLFRNERGEIAIGVNDVFNENESIQRAVTEYYYEDSRTNILQRFLMLTFTYNIRNYNAGKKARENEFQDFERNRRWN